MLFALDNYVFVAQQQGKSGLVARRKPVKLGQIRNDNYQVIEGLQPGENIVISNLLKLSDGSPVIPES